MSTIAVISDVHGNLEALEAVLARISALEVEVIYCLGDVVGYGPDPEACVRITGDRCRMRLMGNHEYALLHEEFGRNFNSLARTAIDWTRARFHDACLLEGIKELRSHHQEGDRLFVHGSPRDSLNDYLFESDQDGYSNFARVLESLDQYFRSFRLCFVGHNHHPFLATREGFLHPHDGMMEFQLPEDEKLYVSVGSVGQPRDRDPRACFATFDGSRVIFHRVAYDIATTAAKIKACGLPKALAERIAVGI